LCTAVLCLVVFSAVHPSTYRRAGLRRGTAISISTRSGTTSELTVRMLIFGERHCGEARGVCRALQRASAASSAELRSPRPESPVSEPVYGRIRRRPVLGGVIKAA
jgi:hypothetical protein